MPDSSSPIGSGASRLTLNPIRQSDLVTGGLLWSIEVELGSTQVGIFAPSQTRVAWPSDPVINLGWGRSRDCFSTNN